MPSLKLYYTPGACSLAAHILLAYIREKEGIEFSIERVDLATHTTEGGKDYFTINERGAVPALQSSALGKEPLTQNSAILNFIADNSKINHLMHKPGSIERARIDEALGFCGDLHSAIGSMFHPAASAEDRAANMQKAHKRLKELEGWLPNNQSWWIENTFTQADLYLAVILSWCKKLEVDLTSYTKARNLMKSVFKMSAAQEAIKAEDLPMSYYTE